MTSKQRNRDAVANGETMKIDVPDYLQERFVAAVAELAVEQARKEFDKKLASAIEKVIREKADAVIEQTVRAEVATILEAGWQRTTQWGDPQGQKVTLRERISDVLTKDQGDSYSKKGNIIEQTAAKVVSEAFGRDFQEEAAKARAAFKKQVDGVIGAKLAEVMRDALGLK